MREELKVKLSVIYSFSVISISVYFAVRSILSYFPVTFSHLYLISILSLYPVLIIRRAKWKIPLYVATVLSFLLAFSVLFAAERIQVPGDAMDAFALLLVSFLIFIGVRDTYRMLYSGLSFYIVGTFLLLAFSLIKIIILIAGILDCYIGCIGETCAPCLSEFPYSLLMFLMVVPALYPYFARTEFRRDVNDKEGT